MKTGDIQQRHQKIAFVQQQLNLLQVHGEYGYDVLEAFRERIKLLNTAIVESCQDDAFEFTYCNWVVCSFKWQDEETVSIVLYDKVAGKVLQFENEYKKGKAIDWTAIMVSIGNYVRELKSS